ncbi:MAG: hypothetical protein EOP10_03930 [Proteobacteria bacterium]|nr:MAG: hypothetical protein EOP10_03930 [Pseudomonadota bacterium]
MMTILQSMFALFILIQLVCCSRDESIAIPEPLAIPDAPPAAGDDAGGVIPDETSTPPEEPIAPVETDSTPPDELILPTGPLKSFFSEPHEALGDLVSFYNRDSGLWPEGFKTSAFAITALSDYMSRTQTLEFTWMLDTTFRKNTFAKESVEDNAAWGLAWLSAYDVTKEMRYINAAKTIAEQINTSAWDETCGGGLYARQDKMAKSAAANLLFIKLNLALFQRLPDQKSYLDRALRTWTWLEGSSLMSPAHQMKGSLAAGSCVAAEDALNTQTQGLSIGALASLFKATNEKIYADQAKLFVQSSLSEFKNADNLLIEKSKSACAPCQKEEPLFKGLFIQNLYQWNELEKSAGLTYFININAQSVWKTAKGAGGLIGYNWQSAFDASDATRQVSGVLLLNTQILKPLERNYALGGDTRTSATCSSNEAAAKAYDGSASTKWCGAMTSGVNHLSVDLGTARMVKSVRILHAGAGAESRTLNTKDFELQISSNGNDFTDLSSIRGNQSSMTYHKVSGTGRYVRLRFTNAGMDNMGRIYEIAVE